MQEAFSGATLKKTEDLRNLEHIPKPVAQVRLTTLSSKPAPVVIVADSLPVRSVSICLLFKAI